MKLALKPFIPKDIRYLVNRLEAVKRFDSLSYPQNVFFDNTKSHTLRLVSVANRLGIPTRDKKKLIRMLFIHDLPEIRYGDVPVIEKHIDNNSLESVLIEEEKIARQIMMDSDYKLFQDFQISYRYLANISSQKPESTDISILANIIDRMDGNIFYHKNLTRWIGSNSFNIKHLPPLKSMQNSFVNDQLYLSKLNSIKRYINKRYYNLFLDILNKKRNKILSFWKHLPTNKIPKEISVFLIQK